MSGTDLSYKDKLYFIDGKTYNCPFCNRRSIKFRVISKESYNKSSEKLVWAYTVQCMEDECLKKSFHLSDYNLAVEAEQFFSSQYVYASHEGRYGEVEEEYKPLNEEDGTPIALDDLFFLHEPTSFFTIDPRIPKEIRTPLAEAENCRKNNFLTGASACLRKAIYKLLKKEKIPEKKDGKNLKYDERIDLLKDKFSGIDGDYFSDLKDVQSITSQEVHENEWQDFDGKNLLLLQQVTQDVLHEIYVLPDERKQRRSKTAKLKAQASEKPKVKPKTLPSPIKTIKKPNPNPPKSVDYTYNDVPF